MISIASGQAGASYGDAIRRLKRDGKFQRGLSTTPIRTASPLKNYAPDGRRACRFKWNGRRKMKFASERTWDICVGEGMVEYVAHNLELTI